MNLYHYRKIKINKSFELRGISTMARNNEMNNNG